MSEKVGIPTTVIRHPKERLAKCSLRHLHGRQEITFCKAHRGFSFDATGFLLLTVDAPVLTAADRGPPLLLLDSTWRLLPKLLSCLRGEPIRRAIPPVYETAYPRSSKVFDDPPAGLASVEALYLARRILGDDDPTLLAGYHWRDAFLEQVRARG